MADDAAKETKPVTGGDATTSASGSYGEGQEGHDADRRRLIKAGIAAGPVILTLRNRKAWAFTSDVTRYATSS